MCTERLDGLLYGGVATQPDFYRAAAQSSAHLLGNGDYEPVKVACAFDGGVPTNMPCISVKPFTLRDKDIQATFYLASNRVSRGY